MSGADVAARGLAARSLAFNAALGGAEGAQSVGYRRDIAEAMLRPVSTVIRQMGLTPGDFGALGDGIHDDGTALAAFAETVGQVGEGIVQLGSGTFAIGQNASGGSLKWTDSHGGMVGRGMTRTILSNVNPAGGRVFDFGASCSHLYFADMTFDGGFGAGLANDLEHIIFHRCRFTTRPGLLANAMKLVTDNMSGGIHAVYFVDCEFRDAGRMNFELQNHNNDGTARYADIHFVRPRIVGAGKVNAALGMGLSFTGKGDNVTIQSPYFDGNSGPQLENAGCDRLVLRDAMIRAATAPVDVPPISFSGRRVAYNANSQCSIDGLTLVRAVGDPGGRPTIQGELSFEVSDALTLRNIKLAVASDAGTNGRHVLSIKGTGTDDDGQPKTCGPVTVEHCDLWSDAENRPVIACHTLTGEQVIAGNTITNGNPSRVGPLVAAFAESGADAYTVHLSANRMAAAVPHSAQSFVFKNNAAALKIEADNPGLPVRSRAVTTIPAGSVSGPLIDHDLPNAGLQLSARPLGPTSGGGVPYGSLHAGSTQMHANLETQASVDVTVELDLTASL